MNDVVIPYRRSRSNELLYTLRSLKNIPHNEVYIIGDDPRLLVNYIPSRQTSDIAYNTLKILNLAINNPNISENFIFIHDDVYIMKPLRNIPVHHRGLSKTIIQGYKNSGKNNYYTRRMQKTYDRLIELGVKQPLCYELHIPFVINKTKWRKVANYITPEYNKLSMYGNLNKIGGTKIRDVKVMHKDRLPTGNFISTHESTFNKNQAGLLVQRTFSERSKYER